MIDKNKFKPLFGDWWEKVEPLFDNGEMDRIYSMIKKRSNSGYKIFPKYDQTLRCFTETPLSNLSVVMMGMCPYHTTIDNIPVADGLMMSCSNHEGYIAPSLDQFYNGIEEEFKDGLCLPCVRTGNLDFLAKQGVLLLNAALTVEMGKPGSHNKLWEAFTTHLIGEVIGNTNVPVILLGREAERFYPYLAPFQWYFLLSHPASASYKGDVWKTDGVFTKVNTILKNQGKPEIQWILDSPPF